MKYEIKETLVTINDVSLKFGDRQVLKHISAEVKDIYREGFTQGQVVGILGPSGVGKTQFSRILTGLQASDTGGVTVNMNGKHVPVTAGLVGVVFQNYPLFAHRTVMGNLRVALEHTGMSKKDRDARIMEYLTKFELTDKVDLYPSQLSGGQRQRIAIIQELLCSEHFLVMDEPFTGLDPLMKDRVCDLINKVAGLHENNTIFVVAHDIAALVSISDTLWLFGRDRDEAGNVVPGAYIKETFNLIEHGLAWRPEIWKLPGYYDFVREVKERFKHL